VTGNEHLALDIQGRDKLLFDVVAPPHNSVSTSYADK
jgi:hypothetical protein